MSNIIYRVRYFDPHSKCYVTRFFMDKMEAYGLVLWLQESRQGRDITVQQFENGKEWINP